MKKTGIIIIGLFVVATLAAIFTYKQVSKTNVYNYSLILKNDEKNTSENTALAAENNWQKEMYDNYFKQAKTVNITETIQGSILPHHLVAGYIPATFFTEIAKQKPSTIVIIGPNHFFRGENPIISTTNDQLTSYGNLQVNDGLIKKLLNDGLVGIDETVIAKEHSITALTPFIKKTLPNTKILPLIVKYQTPTGTLESLFNKLTDILPSDAVIIASIDFSHYMTWETANFHDELTREVIKNFDYSRIDKLDIDSPASLYIFLKLMEHNKTQKVVYELGDNAANIMNQPGAKETTSYFSPWFVKGDKTNNKIASVLFFGDMMLDRNVKKQTDKNGADYLFTKLAGQENRFFLGIDEISANLEGPFANSRRATTKSIAFRFEPKLIYTLKKYNFSIFTLANNHSLDMGKAGFAEGKANLAKAGINFYGQQLYINNDSLLVKKVGDYNIGYIGLDDTITKVDIKKVKLLIDQTKNNGANFIVTNIHWGEEYKEISNTNQRNLAHQLIDAGVDVIIGHHPHVVQEMEIYKNRPIFYSLGNFIFDQYFSVSTQQSLAVGLIFTDKKISTYVFPLKGINSQAQQMEYEIGKKYFEKWILKSRLGNYKFDEFKHLNIEL
ncbi:MAG: hypothetical protein US58_C0016G0012 [Candidatus Magasanikbacteria bacterium GW2011_GWA2_37_8]|uniref:Capsule synthesis protein CapA domain-containing protein n=1 Tax=Candidatus Magasanikbacteria bacterium GW2011_GWA2_37_8 TaxID=1619036 RepID=A0A0G0HPT3_9BACT|nr:MAG: hypothetical protein US58_C0016G0012 [Candidatus Magasanikbacteria bacterium GW2011_GWA2_37_8]